MRGRLFCHLTTNGPVCTFEVFGVSVLNDYESNDEVRV